MNRWVQTGFGAALLACWLAISGCSTNPSRPAGTPLAESAPATPCRACQIAPDLRQRILDLDPDRVTGAQVRGILARAPAPQIIAIHGGILPIKAGMNSLAEFLVAMGYPESSLRNPATGDVAYGYYFDSDRLAGAVAWYTERDGLRPMLVGHSQGGIQVMRVLHKLAGEYPAPLRVWNPETQKTEPRSTIWDPVTRERLPIDRVQVCYAAVAAAGGAARFLPNEWDMNRRLRKVPNSVIDFTGFHKEFDPWGGDYLGYGSANEYQATGTARVENIRLPSSGAHWTIPYAGALLENPEALERIQNYRSAPGPDFEDNEEPSTREAFATVVWYEVKRHWVLELQRLLRAHAASDAEAGAGR